MKRLCLRRSWSEGQWQGKGVVGQGCDRNEWSVTRATAVAKSVLICGDAGFAIRYLARRMRNGEESLTRCYTGKGTELSDVSTA
jgi:hypothetical protein